MLDHDDRAVIANLAARATGPGLYILVGPPDLFADAMGELDAAFVGTRQARRVELDGLTPVRAHRLATRSRQRLYLYGEGQDDVFVALQGIRHRLLAGRVVVVIHTPLSERRLFTEAGAFHSVNRSVGSLGNQRILFSMSEAFQRRTMEILERIRSYDESLTSALRFDNPYPDDCLTILRRWNSFSPIVKHRHAADQREQEHLMWDRLTRRVRGGGYLLRWRGTGVAIDPGHDFIENLYSVNASIEDIDAIVLTHDHLDHTADFEALLDILYQYNDRGGNKSISVFLNPTTFAKYHQTLRHHGSVSRVVELDSRTAYREVSPRIRIRVQRAEHVELGGIREAVSIRFDLYGDRPSDHLIVGFTGDTGWHNELGSFLCAANLVIAHLGSIKDCELDRAEPYATHLGILGLFNLVEFLDEAGSTALVVVSEFGEELRGLRDLVCTELSERFTDIAVFPGDIGHRIRLEGSGRSFSVFPCAEALCNNEVRTYYEADGEIRLGCGEHAPTLRQVIRTVTP